MNQPTPVRTAAQSESLRQAPTGALGSEQSRESESYTHGHHDSVLRSHRSRTAANSAAHLVPLLRPGMSVLDVGCGPGTLTVDLARLVAPGQVTGVDAATSILRSARELAAGSRLGNVSFEHANAYQLPFADDTFDVVHAHQLLQHLSDPVAAIAEMRRVTKPGGIVAARDADYAAMTWYPESAGLTEWNALYHEVTSAYGYQADAGRRLFSWFQEAGFVPDDLTASAGVWCYATPEARSWWGGLWAERCIASNFARQAKESNLADDVLLEELAHEWQRWSEQPDGWFSVLNGEVLARV
ncbi:methyltransferase domain-containing protein [Sanguibacter antarcticus]|uniref:Methyltransferase family protein n=1 Tax=Sanguibacter antarcticus TaxID=372484 RepID=A0A2A9E2W5_9MICO|nr:methyltransferase domain-containing protein [Sanguibacter antarcticus]PFG32695.1 methyltransferase family protein [Sanguibacter antarcticus]